MPTDPEALESCREWLGHVADLDPRSGLYDLVNIREALAEVIEVELGEPDEALLAEFTERAKKGLERQAAVEATWAGRTENDALDDAFAAFNARGLVARQAIGSTLQEGQSRLITLSLDVPGSRGLVFYHRQDLEQALAGETLMLAFASLVGDDDDSYAAVGREVVWVLEHYGFRPKWSGSANTRIALEPFPWRKRRVTRAPPGPALPGPMPAPKPPPAPAVCPHCQGKGWIAPADASKFPELCVCKGGKAR